MGETINLKTGNMDRPIEGFGAAVPPRAPASRPLSKCNSQKQRTHVPFRQGQPEILSEDDRSGLSCSQSTDFLTQEKMHFFTHGKRYFPEDESSRLYFEGRNMSSGELTGFTMDFGYQQNARKLQKCSSGEGCMFPTSRHDVLSGKSAVEIHRPCDSEGSCDREKCKKAGRRDLELPITTGREYSSRSYYKFGEWQRAFEFDFGRIGKKDVEVRHDGYGTLGNSDSGVGISQNILEEYPPSSLHLKPPAWALSANLFSWSSFSNHVASSKDLSRQPHDVFGTKSPHDAPLRSTSLGIYSGPDAELHNQKKPRLGWGQGLAKYEKEKVDGAEDSSDRSHLIQYVTSASWKFEDVGHAVIANEKTRNPETTASASGCRSPGTLYAATGIFSPDEHLCSLGAGTSKLGLYENPCNKILNAVRDTGDFANDSLLAQGTLQVYASQNIGIESSLDSTHLDGNPCTTGNSEVIYTLHRVVPSFGLSCSERAGSIGRLLLLKNDILQKLERIEYEVDTVEKELGCLNSETEGEDCHSQRKVCLYASGDCSLEACMEASEDVIDERFAAGAQVSSTVHLIKGQILVPLMDSEAAEVGVPHEHLTDQCVECQVIETENSTAVMQTTVRQSSDEVEFDGVEYLAANMEGGAANAEEGAMESQLILAKDPKSSSCTETNAGATIQSSCMIGRPAWFTALAAGTNLAKEATELFEKLLPTSGPDASGLESSEISETSVWRYNALIHARNRKQMEEKINGQRHFVNFREKALALKFRVLKEWWREAQLDCCLNSGHQSYHSSDRSRISSSGGALALVPTSEVGQLGRRLVSNVQVSPYRCILKMPAMILHDKERDFSRFSTSNGLVEDPVALEKERTMINPWTSEEKELFWEKFAIVGKNFGAIASLLEHKTVADCVEFYYKNQKSEDAEKIKRRHKLKKQRDYCRASSYLSTVGNKWRRMSNATSLDVLGMAVALATGSREQTKSVQSVLEKCTHVVSGRMRSKGFMKCSSKRYSDADFVDTETECTAAADVLAGIRGGAASEGGVFCISSAEDSSEGFHEKTCSRSFLKKNDKQVQFVTPEAHIEAHCSPEECCEGNIDWTDDEKWLFITAVSMFAKDFGSISSHVHSKTEDQCRTFFCKARKRLRLDELIHQESVVSVGKSRSDYDEGLSETHTQDMLLCNVDASGKTLENSKSKVLHAAKEKARAGRVFVEAVEVCNMKETGNFSRSKDGLYTLNQQMQLIGNVEGRQADLTMASEEASMHREELRHKEKKVPVVDTGSLDISVDDNNFETTKHEFCEPVRAPLLNTLLLNKAAVKHGTSMGVPPNNVDMKTLTDFKSQFQEDRARSQNKGSCMVLVPYDNRLSFGMNEGESPVACVIRECSRSIGNDNKLTHSPSYKSAHCCLTSKSGIVTSNDIPEDTSNGKLTSLHAFHDKAATSF